MYGNGEDEILAVDKIIWTGTTPTTSTFWTFADHQGTIRDIVSGNAADRGKVVEHRQYDSFGKVLARTANLSPGAATLPGSGVGIDFGYAGRPLESRTGLSDNRARFYDPGVGRFINEDPSGFAGGDTNLFRYVGNDPLDRIDPSGLTAKWAGGAKGSVPAAGWGAYGAGGQDFSKLYGSLGQVFDRLPSQQSQAANTFTGKSDRGVPFGEFLVTKPSAARGTDAGSESDSFAWGAAKGVGKGVAGLAVGAVVGVGIAAAAPFVGATGLAIGTGVLIFGAGYGGLQLGRSVYQAYSGSEVTWTGTATGRTFTPSQRGELAGESFVGAATLGFGAAKVLAPRFGSGSVVSPTGVDSQATSGGVRWNNGWRTADGKFASPQGADRSGRAAETAVWDAIEAKPGWQVIRGQVSVRNSTGQLRKYDGAAVSPNGRVIGLEVKSGSANRTPAQSAFDNSLNSSGQDTVPGVGTSSGLQVTRSILIRRP